MAEENMPAIEAVVGDTQDENHYEFAFHMLPTIADEEVTGVFEELKSLIGRHGGVVKMEEAPQRIDLAYRLVKTIDTVNQRFSSSFFGWVRFTLSPEELAPLTGEIQRHPKIIRQLIVRLTKQEVEHPFKMFERRKKSVIVDTEGAASEVPAESTEVLEKELDESLEDLTSK